VLKTLGIDSQDTTLSLPVQGYARKSLKQWLVKEDLNDEQLVVLHPGSSCATKCWPIKSFASLAKALNSNQNVKVVVMGDEGCRKAAQQIKRYARSSVVDVTGNLTVAQMVVLLQKASVLVSNDSGPVHVAAAMNTPVISLFLRNQPGINPERWKPLGEHSITLMNKPGEEIVLNEKSDVIGGKFDSISVDEVLEKVNQILERSEDVS